MYGRRDTRCVKVLRHDRAEPGKAAVCIGTGELSLLSIFTAFVVRCLLVALFLPFSALDKILNFKQAD